MPRDEPPQIDLVRAEFGRRVGYWEEIYGDDRRADYDAHARKEIVLQAVEEYAPRKNARLLDVGCGVGIYLMELARKGYSDLTGIDTTREMIQRARALSEAEFTHGEAPAFFVQDIESLRDTYPSSQFELVIAAGVIEYVSDEDRMLEVIHSMLRPGGYLIITLPNDASATPLRFMIGVKSIWNRVTPAGLQVVGTAAYHRNRYRLGTFTADARTKGFELVEWHGHGHSFDPLTRLLPLFKTIDDGANRGLDSLGRRRGFRWVQRSASDLIVVFKAI